MSETKKCPEIGDSVAYSVRTLSGRTERGIGVLDAIGSTFVAIVDGNGERHVISKQRLRSIETIGDEPQGEELDAAWEACAARHFGDWPQVPPVRITNGETDDRGMPFGAWVAETLGVSGGG